MSLSQMQDIAGCRAVLSDVDKVNELVEVYRKSRGLKHIRMKEREKDYIKNPKKEEEEAIFSIVRTARPNIVIVAFGSPEQELWLDRHNNKFSGIVCIGVGGAFDYFSGNIVHAPSIIRRFGLEWLFRLLIQPWRWRRQLRLIKFIWLVIKQKFGKRNS